MKPYGRRGPIKSTVAEHQHCHICHPENVSKNRARIEGRKICEDLSMDETQIFNEDYYTCPICDGPAAGFCRCMIGECICDKGHRWLMCPVHEKRISIASNVDTHDGRFTLGKCWCHAAD